MISPDDLQYFMEVSNTLNLSRASERLGISQPSLSAAMQRLERFTGTALLVRHKKGVTLTSAGKQLLIHAKQLQEYWEIVQSRLLLANEELQGRFTMGCPASIALSYLSKILPDLLEHHKKLEIELKHDNSRKILESILDSSIDIGLIVNPVKHPQLIMQKLCEDETAFWHLQDKKKIQSFRSGEAILICDPALIQVQALLKRLDKKGMRYARMLGTHNLEVIADLTAQGGGIGILPTSLAKRFGKLKKIANTPTYPDEIYLVYRPENRTVKAIQTIASAIKAFFSHA